MSFDYYDKQGNPLTDDQYMDLLRANDKEYKRVDRTIIGDITISTVWLGIDHGWGDEDLMIFETMQFGGEDDQELERYATLHEAQAGHDAWVKRIKDSE